MAIQIVDQPLFHINKTVSYSPHAPMQFGDVIDVGARSNPLFGFYETGASWVSDGNEGFKLVRELVWENIRLREFPDAPSRQRCLWVTETEAEVQAWKPAGYQIVKLRASGTLLKTDCKHLPMPGEAVPPLSAWYDRARRYWRGDLTEHPQPEFLFVGTARVEAIV